MKNAIRFNYFFGLLKIDEDGKLPFWDNFLAVNEEEDEEYSIIYYKTFIQLVFDDYRKDKRNISFEEYIDEQFPPNKKE